ncbi:MAG: 4-hydroxy-tetrahydrodipicolinate synthase [Actinomycetota bacterium]
MASDLDLRGVWVPLITPFDAAGAVDAAAIERLCHRSLDAGASGIVALGTTGESSALDDAERRLVVDTVSAVCAARGSRVIVGTGSNNTAHTVEATRALAGIPAVVGALVVVPYYVRPSEAGIVAHFRAVAAESPVPLVLYNIPARTGRGLGADALLELAAVDDIAGVKQAVSALDADTLALLADAPDGFGVLGGEDTLLFPLMCMGAVGAISAAAHLCTDRFVTMIEHGLAGKVDDGRAIAEALLPVVQTAFAEPNPAVFKAVLHARGLLATPDVRMPLLPASAAARDACLAAVASAES